MWSIPSHCHRDFLILILNLACKPSTTLQMESSDKPMSNPLTDDPSSREICILHQKQKSITFLLQQTRQNLKYFSDLCRTNPSSEVESLGRYSLDRITQLQVELKGVRAKLKIHNRARFRPSRSAFADSEMSHCVADCLLSFIFETTGDQGLIL